jgi:protein-tyrosine-phosphatase
MVHAVSQTKLKERFPEWRVLYPFRLLVRLFRGLANGLLHPFRRFSLRRRLAGLPPVKRVLVLCLGNVCRSPYGAARLVHGAGASSGNPGGGGRGSGSGRRKTAGSPLEVRSAGLMGFGNPAPDTARRVAATRGLDLEEHASQLVTQEMVQWADLIVAMDPGQGMRLEREYGAPARRIVILGDLDPGLPGRRDIPDPLGASESFFEQTYERMDRCLDELFLLIGGAS